MAKVSIIIAAYNVEDYIREAVDSAVGQTLQDIEIICVDDCSTDGTAEILNEYAAKDSRVRVIRHESNKGSLYARHTGAMAARGQYVLFLDGDDYFASDTCDVLYQKMISGGLDILDFGIAPFDSRQNYVDPKTLEAFTKFFLHAPQSIPQNHAELLTACFGKEEIRWNLCGKMYSLQLIQKAYSFFNGERICMAEDMLISFMAFYYAEAYGYLDRGLYHYRIGSGVTANSLPPTEKKMEAMATEYQVHRLLTRWLTPEQQNEKCVDDALDFVYSRTREDVLYSFFCRARPEDCLRYLGAILQYCTLEQFVLDCAEWIATAHVSVVEMIAMRLKECMAFAPQKKNVKTVASFYYRMYNGGVERVMALLAPIWQLAGYQVVIITEEAPSEMDYPLPDGVKRVVFPHTEDGRARVLAWKQILQENSIDAVVYHAWLYENRFLDALSIKLQGAAFILHTHGIATRVDHHPAVDALSDVVLTLSEVDQAWWSALGYRSVYIVNPLTYLPKHVVPSKLENHDALWIGRLSEEKQYLDAFEIAKLVRERIPDFRLHVVGTSKDFDRLKASVENSSLAEYIVLHGYHTDMTEFFQNASVFLFTSILKFEGAPMTITESKVFGLPVVTYELANVSALRNGKGMRIVGQRDYQAAAEQVIQLMEDASLCRELGDEARRSAEELAGLDFVGSWKNIFDLAVAPQEAQAPLYQQPPLHAALRIAMVVVEQNRNFTMKKRKSEEQLIWENGEFAMQNAQYAVMVEEIMRSSSYQLGRKMTALPRMIKTWLQGGK